MKKSQSVKEGQHKFSGAGRSILEHACFSPEAEKELISLCESFLKKNKLAVFGLIRVYDDHSCFALFTDQRIPRYLVENKVRIICPIAQQPWLNLTRDEKFWHYSSKESYEKVTQEMNKISGANSFLNFIKRHSGYYDAFCFWSPFEKDLATNQFMNLKEACERFSSRFEKVGQELICLADQDRFTLPEEMRTNIIGRNREGGSDEQKIQILFDEFSRDVTQFSNQSDLFNLTKRELECIHLLLRGLTAKDMAQTLGLSRRTVEFYLDNIKTKVGCTRKSGIIEQLFKSRVSDQKSVEVEKRAGFSSQV